MARTKEFDQEETLKKAMIIFWAKGFSATSMQDLVEGLGISRSSMYDTYGDKEALFYAALEDYTKQQISTLESLITMVETPLQAINALLEGTVADSIGDEMNKGCFVVNSIGELNVCNDKVKTLISNTLDKMTEEIMRWIVAGQQIGEINNRHTPAQWASFVTNTIAGLRVAARSGIGVKSLNDTVAITITALKA